MGSVPWCRSSSCPALDGAAGASRSSLRCLRLNSGIISYSQRAPQIPTVVVRPVSIFLRGQDAMWLTGSWCSSRVSRLSLRWDSQVQDTGPPETSWPHVISIGESSHRDLHLNAKIQPHSMTSKLQCWTPHAKQLARQEHSPTH